MIMQGEVEHTVEDVRCYHHERQYFLFRHPEQLHPLD